MNLIVSRPHLQPHGDGLILNIAVTAPPQAHTAQQRVPLDLAIALDVSGSMNGSKLAQAKLAAQRLISRLTGDDTCSLVVFSSTARVIHSSTPMHDRGRALLSTEIEALRTGGNTALHAGWDAAVQTIQHCSGQRGSVRRVFLLTDGAANEGLTDPETLATLAATAQQNGITTSAFGLGLSYNEQLLNKMATAGEGNCYHITEPAQIDTFFGQELNQLFTTTLRDVVVSLRIPAALHAHVVGDRNHQRDGDVLRIPLATLMSAERRDIMLLLQPNRISETREVALTVTVHGNGEYGERVEAVQTFTLPIDEAPAPCREELERTAALTDAAAAMATALERVRFDRAAAYAAFDERAARFPLLAQYSVYQQEKTSLPDRADEEGLKRRRMRSKDEVNGSHMLLQKYESILATLIAHAASAESIAEARADLERMRDRYGL